MKKEKEERSKGKGGSLRAAELQKALGESMKGELGRRRKGKGQRKKE